MRARSARSKPLWWLGTVLLMAATAVAACGGDPGVAGGDPGSAGTETEGAGADPDAGAEQAVREPCGPAPFLPGSLPWAETAGEPDAVVDETDDGWGQGVTSMWWWEQAPATEPDGAGTWPWSGEDAGDNRYVVLQRGVDEDVLGARGVGDPEAGAASEGEVRGHPALLTVTGDPGVGGASLLWTEGAERCGHYMLIAMPWDSGEALWSVAPD